VSQLPHEQKEEKTRRRQVNENLLNLLWIVGASETVCCLPTCLLDENNESEGSKTEHQQKKGACVCVGHEAACLSVGLSHMCCLFANSVSSFAR